MQPVRISGSRNPTTLKLSRNEALALLLVAIDVRGDEAGGRLEPPARAPAI
jgi:hypothetical protein